MIASLVGTLPLRKSQERHAVLGRSDEFPALRSAIGVGLPAVQRSTRRCRGLRALTLADDLEEERARRMRALRDPLVRHCMRSVRDRAEADDLVQDVFLRIIRRGPMDSFENFTSYAYQAADSALKDRARRRMVRQSDRHIPFDPSEHAASTPGPDRELIARDELRQASIVLARLPERTRAVFILRRLDHMPFSEIAIRLGISVSAAEKHMLRATRELIASAREES